MQQGPNQRLAPGRSKGSGVLTPLVATALLVAVALLLLLVGPPLQIQGPARAAAAAAILAAGGVLVLRTRSIAAGLIASHRAQGEFLANMSHEIRTPLNGVVAVADALERTGLSPRQAELVRIIRGSGQTLERLLSDVLDLSKIETGALSIEAEPFPLAETLRAVAALCAPRAEEKGVELRLDLHPSGEAMVVGDVVRLRQVATNLVSNAVKFTERGHVALRLRPGRAPGAWRIEVADTGVGFDPAKKELIFSRFAQADGSVTRRFGGSGLGLAISRQLVGLMGGTLDCESRPGAGSVFRVDLPLPWALSWAPPPADAPAPPLAPDRLEAPLPTPRPSPSPGPRLRVLAADDHPTNRTVLQVLLAHLDLEVVMVEDGLAACQAFESAPFDLVLMDMQMPVLDGVSAIRRLRLFERRGGRAPALMVMLTANAMAEHEAQSRAAGADLHIAKPIEPSRLFAAVEAARGRTRGVSSTPDSRFG